MISPFVEVRRWSPLSLCGYVLLCMSLTGCGLLDSRPQNLRGTVHCQSIPHQPTRPLFVKVVLDEAAIRQHSRFDVIREVMVPKSSNEEVQLLAVDVGSAMGAIDGCGTFLDTAFEITITDQMLSYPSWIRISSRAGESVLLSIQDVSGQDVAAPLLLEPQERQITLQWLR